MYISNTQITFRFHILLVLHCGLKFNFASVKNNNSYEKKSILNVSWQRNNTGHDDI